MTVYTVYKDNNNVYYSEGVLTDGEYHHIQMDNSVRPYTRLIFPLDECFNPVKTVGYIEVEI